MSAYNFTQTLRPYGDSPDNGVVQIDPTAKYGYWEHRDGTEGGGLWFERISGGVLELVDYDGAFELPRQVLKALTDAGIVVGPNY